MHTSNLAVHKYKIDDRRRRVASMLAKSMTETKIAQELKVDQSTISKDIKVLKRMSQQFVIRIRDKAQNKISIVGHSLGGYIAAQVAIENREMVEKLVLIDSSGLLTEPTPLLVHFHDAAIEVEPILRYKKLKRALGNLYANPLLMPVLVVDLFVGTIIQPGAKFAFEKTFENSTTTHIEQNGFDLIRDIPCLIIWGQKDNLIPIECANEFKKV